MSPWCGETTLPCFSVVKTTGETSAMRNQHGMSGEFSHYILKTRYPHKLARYSKSTPATKRRNLGYNILPYDIKSLYTEDTLEAPVAHLVW